MLLTSRLLSGFALASALNFIASVAAAAPITRADDRAAMTLFDTQTELPAFIEGVDGTISELPDTEGHLSPSGVVSADDLSAAIGRSAMDDFLLQEPLVASEPTSLVLTALGLMLLAGFAGRHWLRHHHRHHHHHRHRHRLPHLR